MIEDADPRVAPVRKSAPKTKTKGDYDKPVIEQLILVLKVIREQAPHILKLGAVERERELNDFCIKNGVWGTPNNEPGQFERRSIGRALRVAENGARCPAR